MHLGNSGLRRSEQGPWRQVVFSGGWRVWPKATDHSRDQGRTVSLRGLQANLKGALHGG